MKIGETYKLKPVEKRKRLFSGSIWLSDTVTVNRIDSIDETVFVFDGNGHWWIPAQWLKRNKL